MKFKLLFIAALFSGAVVAQKSKTPFIGRTWLKPPTQAKAAKSFAFPGSPANSDTTFYQFKALTGVAYSYPDYKAMGLTGISFQHVLYRYQTADAPDQAYVDWAVNLVYGGGFTTTPNTKDVDFSSFGIGGSFFDKKVSLYILGSRYTDKVLPTPTTPDPVPTKKTIKPVFAISYSL